MNKLGLTTAQDVVQVKEPVVKCDGGGSNGHPLVYLHIKGTSIECPYCSKVFMLTEQ